MMRFPFLAIAWPACACWALAQPPASATRPPAQDRSQSQNAEAPVENLTSFDCRQADIQWLDGRWQLRAGSVFLKDFGRQEATAREAVRIVRTLQLSELGSIGTPQPVLEYWLSGGKAPANSLAGSRTTPFERETLRVERIQGQWCLRDARQTLFSFGYREDEARQALAIIRKYGFDQVGYVGRPAPVMIYFLAGQGAQQLSMHDGPGTQPRSMLQNNPFVRQILHKSAKEDTADSRAAVQGSNANEPPVLPSVRQLSAPRLSGPPRLATEDRVAVDWRHVELRQDGADWKLLYGKYALAEFGSSESDARVALAVVQHYRFTEHCLIGRPKVVFSYFLVSGQAPHGICFGAHSTLFRPEALSVQKQGEEWVISESGKVICCFGDNSQ